LIAPLLIAWQTVGPAATQIEPICEAGPEDAIVVCARGEDAERYRIPPALRDLPPEEGARRIAVNLGEGRTVQAYAEQTAISGWPSRRAMITFTTPF
jgi:hypothetical protein